MGRGETNAKKRKRRSEAQAAPNGNGASTTSPEEIEVVPSKEAETPKPKRISPPARGRDWTLSVALPGSIIAGAQSHEQQNFIAGQIARALAVFNVDEVVIFNDGSSNDSESTEVLDDYSGDSHPDHFLIHLLSYLEAPIHLRSFLFPLHPNLKLAGTLPSLDMPHHLKKEEWSTYREGVTLPGANNHGTFVEAGLRVPVTVKAKIPENTRVTLKFGSDAKAANKNPTNPTILAEAVDPAEPREEAGLYWGYNVRKAGCFSDVITECTYDGGYDMTIGTSEHGDDIETLYSDDKEQNLEGFKHMLITFGGENGLEGAAKNDPDLAKMAVQAKDVFDKWLNLCPGQGSRSIRTEEALWIGLMGLRRLVNNNSR